MLKFLFGKNKKKGWFWSTRWHVRSLRGLQFFVMVGKKKKVYKGKGQKNKRNASYLAKQIVASLVLLREFKSFATRLGSFLPLLLIYFFFCSLAPYTCALTFARKIQLRNRLMKRNSMFVSRAFLCKEKTFSSGQTDKLFCFSSFFLSFFFLFFNGSAIARTYFHIYVSSLKCLSFHFPFPFPFLGCYCRGE